MIRFVDLVARTLPASRLKAMSAAMILNEDEEYLLIERCANRKTIDQCMKVSVRRQRELLPVMNTKVKLWTLQELDKGDQGFFTVHEQRALLKVFKDRKDS